MHYTDITGDDDYILPTNGVATLNCEVSIYIPASIGAASIVIGWLDKTNTFNPYVNGVLVAGAAQRFLSGSGVRIRARVTGFTTAFSIGFAV